MIKTIISLCFVSLFGSAIAQPDWQSIKNSQFPQVLQGGEYGTPRSLGISNLGWEDGQYITRDGLTVYCFYAPVDFLVLDEFAPPGGPNPCSVTPFMRGPSLGVTFNTIPTGLQGICTEFLNSNIIMSHRNSVQDPFPGWTPTSINFPAVFDGAPQLILNENDPSVVDYFVFAQLNPDSFQSADTTGTIYMYTNTTLDPSGAYSAIPAPVNTDSTSEDNPHLERISANNLVLMFTSEDRPGGTGDIDIWVSESMDTGGSWSNPQLVNFSSPQFEDMPHLWKDEQGIYWLYYMDSTATIQRRKQQTPGNWVNWEAATPILSGGTAGGVGEPTLTQWGDIVFGLVYDAGGGWGTDSTDRFDDDIWILPRLGSPLAASLLDPDLIVDVHPNPTNNEISFSISGVNHADYMLNISSPSGEIVRQFNQLDAKNTFNVRDLSSGIYFYHLIDRDSGRSVSGKFVRN